jgi:hypothetical protein
MKPKTAIIVVIILAVGLMLSAVISIAIPGVRERNTTRKLHESNQKLAAYNTQLGPPTSNFSNYQDFKTAELYRIFEIPAPPKPLSYACWAKEGLPYYYILAAYDPVTTDVVEVHIKLLW